MIPKAILRRLLLALASVLIVGLIVAPLTLLWAALYTESGAQFVVRHLPRHLGPVDLDITGLSGSVAHGLHVERVEIDHELVHLTLPTSPGGEAGTAAAADHPGALCQRRECRGG